MKAACTGERSGAVVVKAVQVRVCLLLRDTIVARWQQRINTYGEGGVAYIERVPGACCVHHFYGRRSSNKFLGTSAGNGTRFTGRDNN